MAKQDMPTFGIRPLSFQATNQHLKQVFNGEKKCKLLICFWAELFRYVVLLSGVWINDVTSCDDDNSKNTTDDDNIQRQKIILLLLLFFIIIIIIIIIIKGRRRRILTTDCTK